jgi:hypothetical protein
MRNHRICNISESGSRRRAWLGAALLAAGFAGVLLVYLGSTTRWWLAPLFFVFWAGALGVLQAQEHVCVALAALGVREGEGGVERETDSAALRKVRRRSLAVLAESAALGALLTISAALLLG